MIKKRYQNPYIRNLLRSPIDFALWQLGFYDDIMPPRKPCEGFYYPMPESIIDSSLPTLCWVNHSTFLIALDGLHILTDPIWSERASPLPFIGPKRRHPPAIALDELPQIDLVLISHNHYDHLDLNTVRELHSRFPHIQWIVPKGVKRWFTKRGIHKVEELGWWEECKVEKGVSICGVPAQHNSGRGLFDANSSLWMGFVVKSADSQKQLYFVGDTAYNPYDFKKIGEHFPRIDLTICPIGTYKPGKFMRTVHSSPEDAVSIHQDVKSALTVGMHWKTFRLSGEQMDQPPYDLYLEMKKRGLPPEQFLPIEPGKMLNW